MRDLLVLQHDIGQVNFDLDTKAWEDFSTKLETHKNEEE